MIFFILFALAVYPGSHGQHVNYNPTPVVQEESISSRFNYFDLELLQGFDDSQNYFISPASIKATLGMVLEGARGLCAEEISRVLRIPLDQSSARNKLQGLLYDLNSQAGSTRLESANAAFISDVFHIVPEFKHTLKQYYRADVQSVDFSNNDAASKLINGWVSNATHGLIKEIVTTENFNSDATLVITNALYFKGQWQIPFDDKSTNIKCFYNRQTPCKMVKMMQIVETYNYKYIDDIDAQAISLPYGDGKYAMMVLLPSEKHSVEGLIRDLQHNTFAAIVNKLEATEVSLVLPKFDIDYSGDIVPNLQALGILEIFGQNANLSGIIEAGQVKVSNIVHKAKVQVNEKGTVAVAATGAIVIPLMGSSMPRFIADRPFLFFIYNTENNNILFEGRLNHLPAVYDEIWPRPPSQPLRPQPIPTQQNRQNYQPQNRQAIPLTSSQAQAGQSQQVFFHMETKTSSGNQRHNF